MFKRLIASAILGCIATSAYATQNYMPMGSNLTWGATAQHQYLMSHKNNPATGASISGWRTVGFGFGLIGPVGIGIDVGPLGQAANTINDLSQLITEFDTLSAGDPAAINLSELNRIIDFADNTMYVLSDAIDINISAGAQIPLFPLVFTHKKLGSFMMDVNLIGKARVQFLDSPLDSNPLIDPLQGLQEKYTTNSALYLKAAGVMETAFGYSRKAYDHEKGTLYAGAKLNIYSVSVNKELFPLLNLGGIQDQAVELMQQGGGQKSFGLDLGAVWMADYYRLGATIRNINAPSFAYNSLGSDCETKSSAEAIESCYRAQAYADEIDLNEEYVMLPQINLEAAIFSKSRNWVATAALETNPANDPVGNAHQWATLSAGYAAPNQLLPGVRLGYRKNMAGSGLSYLSAGLNWLMIYVDVAVSTQKINLPDKIDLAGSPINVPPAFNQFGRRSAFFSVGTDFVW